MVTSISGENPEESCCWPLLSMPVILRDSDLLARIQRKIEDISTVTDGVDGIIKDERLFPFGPLYSQEYDWVSTKSVEEADSSGSSDS
jgi:hypothetical protein